VKHLDMKDHTISVPPSVAVCPYCGASLTVQVEAWTADGNDWMATECNPECQAEPELDDDNPNSIGDWEDFVDVHAYMPYVYWMPVQDKLLQWLNKNYRFRDHGTYKASTDTSNA
jgi:hypothetical protein